MIMVRAEASTSQAYKLGFSDAFPPNQRFFYFDSGIILMVKEQLKNQRQKAFGEGS